MSKVFINETNLTNISNAIRQKGNTANLLKPNQMGPAIDNIKTNAKLRPTFISFQNLLTVQSINLKKVITDKVKNMDYMFKECESMTSIDLKNFITNYRGAIIGVIVALLILFTRLHKIIIAIVIIIACAFAGNYIQQNKYEVKEKLKNFIDRV